MKDNVYKLLYENLKKKRQIEADLLKWYTDAYDRECKLAGKYAAELEKRKKDEAGAFLKGIYTAAVTFLIVVGIVAACVR